MVRTALPRRTFASRAIRQAPIIDIHPGFPEPRAAQAPGRALPRPARSRRSFKGLAALLLVALALGAAVLFRGPIVEQVPQLGGLYAAIGLPVNLHGIELQGITAARIFPGGWERLRVEGTIVNITDHVVTLPTIELAIRGADGQEIGRWQAAGGGDRLEAGASLRFATEFADPPAGAASIALRLGAEGPRSIEVR